MDIEYAKNPQWGNEEGTSINLLVKFSHIEDEIPFSASLQDVEAHGVLLFNNAKRGDYGVVAEYIPSGVVVPQSVSSRQAKRALLDVGLFLSVEELINSMEGEEGLAARIEWGASVFQRNSSFLLQMAKTLGLSESELDDLFLLANTYD